MGGKRILMIRGLQDLHLPKLLFMHQEAYLVSGSTSFTSWARPTARYHQHLFAALGRFALKSLLSHVRRGEKQNPQSSFTPAIMQLAHLSLSFSSWYIYPTLDVPFFFFFFHFRDP